MKTIKKLPSNKDNNNKKSSGSDHDSLFVAALSDPRIAKDFLQQYLPPTLLAAIDLNTLEICKDKFIDENLDSRMTDMLCRIKLKNSTQHAYVATLLEHRSTPQKHMPLRILHYETSIMKAHLKQYKRIPLVFSLVYYNGEQRWNYPLDLKTLINAPLELVEQYALKPVQLVQLNQISDESLRGHVWSSLLSLIMKHIFDRDILPVLKEMMTLLKEAERQNGHEFVCNLLYYIYKKGAIQNETEFRELIASQLSEEIEAEIMTLAQKHTEQGIQQGIQQGERKLLLHLLERRFGTLSPNYVGRLSAANDEQLLAWSDRILNAKQLDDVFEV